MKLSALLAPLLDAKADHETIRLMILAFESEQIDALEKRRESDRKRQADKRERDASHVTSRDVTVTGPSHAPAARVEDNLLPKKISGQKENKKLSFESEFSDTFWPAYPRKASKGQALKAFLAARKAGTPLETIMAGVHRYAAARQGEDQHFTKHASAWLHGICWEDEPPPKPMPRATPPPGKPQTIGEMFREDARQNGILNDHAPDDSAERMENSNGSRQDGGAGGPRLFAITGDILGDFGQGRVLRRS